MANYKKIAQVKAQRGYKTKEMRDNLGLKNPKRKLAEVFEVHCVDSWYSLTGGLEDTYSRITDNFFVITPASFSPPPIAPATICKGGYSKALRRHAQSWI